jgi:nucleotide sugar dehydrogenase
MTADHVLVIGQGYVGLPLAMRAVDAGFVVTGLDLDEVKVRSLNAGESPVDDVSDETLRAALSAGCYRATTCADDDLRFDVAVISVPTPLKDSVPDLAFIEAGVTALAALLTPGCTVILESTTYPGTTERLVAPLLEAGSGLKAGVDFHLGYSPERIDPGNEVWTLGNTPKVVSGLTPDCLVAVRTFYDRIVETTVPVSSPRTAELTKLLENTFRHVNIALVNELAVYAHDLDIDVWEAIDAASTKPFGYMRFTPGPGVGGHCLPIDPSYLSWEVRRTLGCNFRFVELANDINDHMPDYVVTRATGALNRVQRSVSGSVVLLVGLAYKRNTGDARESPSTVIGRKLDALGATVLAVDPRVSSEAVPVGIELFRALDDVPAGVDLALVLVDHSDVDLAVLHATADHVLDCRDVVPAAPNVERL